jgi:zinc protease
VKRLAILAPMIVVPMALAAQFPTEPPASLTRVPARELTVTESILPNGLRLVVVPQSRHPVLSITLALPAGTAYDPAGKEGVADLLTRLLPRGAGTRSAADIATTIENLGGSLGVADDPDALTIQLDITANHAAAAFALLGDIVTRPTLDSAQLDGYRQEALARMALEQDNPAALATRVFLIGAYRQHPYGRRPTPQSVRTITRSDVVAYYRARVRPTGAVLVVAGDITAAAATQLVTRSLGAWKGLRAAPLAAVTLTPTPPTVYLLHQGGQRNAAIVYGTSTFGAGDSSYATAAVLNQILGESNGSRLSQSLANEHGWTDAVRSAFLRTSRLGLFQVTATAPTVVADSAIQEIQAQLVRLRDELVPARELERARDAARGAAALRIQTVSQLSAALAQQRLAGLPATALTTGRDRLATVSAAAIRALARRVTDPKNMVLVVAGDASRLYQPLSRLGPVKIFGADGRQLTPDDVLPKDAPLVYDSTRIVPRIDSLAIISQGQIVGLQVSRVAIGADTVGYSEQTTLGPQFNQSTSLSMDRAIRMRRVDQTGTVRGQATKIALQYAGGRVRGESRVMSADGPRTLAVDSRVPVGVLDDNAIQAILPWLDWELNRRWTVPVFASGENLVRNQSLTVANIETVRTPAGDYETYRADLEGGPQLVSFYVTTAKPHRLVRLTVDGSPLEFLAVNR